jgi:hypothetical protein
MNNVAISNHLLVTMLQGQNVKRETVKKMDKDEECKVNNENITEDDNTKEEIKD